MGIISQEFNSLIISQFQAWLGDYIRSSKAGDTVKIRLLFIKDADLTVKISDASPERFPHELFFNYKVAEKENFSEIVYERVGQVVAAVGETWNAKGMSDISFNNTSLRASFSFAILTQ